MSDEKRDSQGLTSPGTIRDPKLEEQRAREAAEREAESRASDETKFEEQREAVAAEQEEAVRTVADVPPKREN